MCWIRSAIVCGVIIIICIGGCGKKEKQQVLQQPPPTTHVEEKPKQDVFDEFYQGEQTGSAQTGKKDLKDQTFSPKAGTSPRKSVGLSEFPDASAFTFDKNGQYVIQVGCVASASSAEKRVEQLKEQGYPAYAVEVDNPKPELSGRYYRIRIGGFSGISEARRFGEAVFGPNGYWIDKKANDRIGMEVHEWGRDASTGPRHSVSASSGQSSVWGASSAYTETGSISSSGNAGGSAALFEASSGAIPRATTPSPATPNSSPDTAASKKSAWDDGWGSSDDSGW